MAPTEPLDGDEAEQYERSLREHDALTALLRAAAVDAERDDLETVSVTRHTGEIRNYSSVRVTLEYDPNDGDSNEDRWSDDDRPESFVVTGQFEDGELVEAELQTGSTGGGLVGRGRFWEYRDGEVREGHWTA